MQGKKKTLEEALSQEAAFPKDTASRYLTPTKGRGINTETYRLRRMCTEQDSPLRVTYDSMLDGFYTTMHTSMRAQVTKLYRQMYEERETLGFSRFDELGKRGFWKFFTMFAAQNCMRIMPGSRLLCLYGIYEKEIDDYVRSFYGMDNLNNMLVPLLPDDPGILEDSTEAKLKGLGDMLASLSTGDKDAMQKIKDQEEERVMAGTQFNCVFIEAMCVEWGIYKDLFGYELPYQAPFGTKKIGFGK